MKSRYHLLTVFTALILFCIGLSFNTNAIAVQAENVAVVVNLLDANSVEIGDYYLAARNIPRANLIQVSIPKGSHVLSEEAFSQLKSEIDAKSGKNIDVITLVWTSPYAVNCNSITSAMTIGYQSQQCLNTCAAGVNNPYFNSPSRSPSTDLNLKLSILMPTDSVELAKAIIDRGVLSGFKRNEATGYFIKTSDSNRSKPREPFFPRDLFQIKEKSILFRTLKTEHIKDKKDIMFYFTGHETVAHLETLNFLPGAIADHLTSFGGVLHESPQMSVIKWLEAGATGSYGSVSEPCNHWQKFPNPKVLVAHYLAGETLVESYWKSVVWPTQGLIVGEPLSAPYFNKKL